MPFAFSVFLYPLCLCPDLRLFYSTKSLPLRAYWAYHVLLYEPDNLAPVCTPKELERRTLSIRTTWLLLLTFCPQRLSRFGREGNRFRCLTMTMLSTVHVYCAYYLFPALYRLRLAALSVPHGSFLSLRWLRVRGVLTVSFIQNNYSSCTSHRETLGRTSGKIY
jgi:hypothetical protein